MRQKHPQKFKEPVYYFFIVFHFYSQKYVPCQQFLFTTINSHISTGATFTQHKSIYAIPFYKHLCRLFISWRMTSLHASIFFN